MVEVHLALVIATALAVFIADEQALVWMLGKKEVLSQKVITALHLLTTFGLGGILVTGGLMFINRISYLLSEPIFIIKMIFVGALVINAFFIERLAHIAYVRSFKSLSPSEKLPLLISGGVSVSGWVGAIVCGLLL